MVQNMVLICRPGLYRLVQFTKQSKLKAKKELNSCNLSFHKWQYWMASNADNAPVCGLVQNMYNLRTQLKQSTDQQKVVKQLANGWN